MIFVYFLYDLHLEFSWSNREFATSQPKNGPIATKMKGKHDIWILGLKCGHPVWLSQWPWSWIFKVKYLICCILWQNEPITTKWLMNISNWTLGLKCSHEFWPWILNNCMSAKGRTDWREIKRTQIYWLLSQQCELNLDNTWPGPWIFQIKFWNSCISGIGGPIDIEQKGCELFIHDHDCEILVTTSIRCKDLVDSDWGDFRCRCAVDLFAKCWPGILILTPVKYFFLF